MNMQQYSGKETEKIEVVHKLKQTVMIVTAETGVYATFCQSINQSINQ